MTRLKLATLTFMGCVIGLFGNIENNGVSSLLGLTLPVEVTISKAYAARRGYVRRTSRRVARRTTRRVVRRATLPGGCVWRSPYHYCGGIYYRPIVENGTTVYIVVYP